VQASISQLIHTLLKPDCAEGLVCHQRSDNDPVPSCAGAGAADNDYCIRPSDETAKPPIPGAFRLKLYWEPGFEWQEQFWEQEWCMRCESSMKSEGGPCELFDTFTTETCNDDTTWFVFENLASNGETQLQIAESALCLELIGQRQIELRTCVASSARQKFVAGLGSFGGEKFELKTVVNGGCLSQHHHPKPDEIIYRNDCETTRDSDTSFWMQY